MSQVNSNQLSLPSNIKFIRTFSGIEEYELDNGLKFLLFHDPSQANVTVNITYLVGSRHEGRGEAGMAHLLEHMLFKQTKNCADIKGVLQDKGAQYNATTWFDRTNYFETLTPSFDNLEFALKLEADRMLNSSILEEDLAAEMTVVRNEFEMGENNPIHVLHDQIMSAAYRWHNYGKTTIGNRSDIERVPAASLKKFYEHYYQPDNAVLIVAGQFDKKYAIDLIAKYYGPLSKPQRKLESTYTEEPAQDGPREVILERVADVASVACAYHIVSASHVDHAPLKVLMNCLVDEPAGFLYKKFIETAKASEIFSEVYSLFEPGMAMCFLRPSHHGQAVTLRDELCHLIESAAFLAINESEVKRIKARFLKRIKQAMSNSKDMALKLSEAIASGDWRLFFWQKEQIEAVELADVVRVAKKYLVRSNRTSGVFLPQQEVARVHIEKPANVSELLANLVDKNDISDGELFVANPKNIEAKISRKVVDQTLKMAFLPKKTRGQSVRAKMIFRFANEDAIKPFIDEWSMIPAMLWRGCAKYDYQGIRDRIDSLMSTLDIDTNSGILWASIKSEHKYLPETIQLLADILKNPSFKEEEYLVVKNREIDDYEEIKTDPQRLGFQELDRLKHPWPKDSIHYLPTFEERIATLKGMSLERIKDAFYSLFSSKNLHFSLVGEADVDNIFKLLPSLFGQEELLALAPYERVKRPFIENKVEYKVFNTKDKEMAIIAYGFNFVLRDDHEDFAALKLLNYIFGENMNSRLVKRVREKEGFSYGAGSWLEVGRHEENASFNMYAMAAPQNVSQAKKAMEEEWQLFLDKGVSNDELLLAKESILSSFENSLANDGNLVSLLASDLDINRDFHWRDDLFTRIRKLSITELSIALEKWWKNARFSVVVAGDEAKMK